MHIEHVLQNCLQGCFLCDVLALAFVCARFGFLNPCDATLGEKVTDRSVRWIRWFQWEAFILNIYYMFTSIIIEDTFFTYAPFMYICRQGSETFREAKS